MAYKVNANGGNVRLGVGVVRESQQQAGLAHAGVADQQQFEQVVTGMGNYIRLWFVTHYSGFIAAILALLVSQIYGIC